jgi:polysaccharide export outer membrane protein
MFKYLSILIIFLSLNSCITNKDIDVFASKENTSFESYDYNKKLKAGDLLSVQIHTVTPIEYDLYNKKSSQPQLYNPYLLGYVINDSGYVTLPLIGEVFLKDKTFEEAENLITELSSKFLQNPTVKINLLNFQISVLGSVNSPGKHVVNDRKINVLDAIGLAGGFVEQANRKKIKIIRFNDNKSKIYYLDLSDPNVSKSSSFYLESNDIVFVVPVKKRFVVLKNLTPTISVILSTLSLYLLFTQSK